LDRTLEKSEKISTKDKIILGDKLFLVESEVSLDKLNELYIKYILGKYDGAINQTANVLGISRSTLWRKLKEEK
jgi:DNA-binding NtrC family response regulator